MVHNDVRNRYFASTKTESMSKILTLSRRQPTLEGPRVGLNIASLVATDAGVYAIRCEDVESKFTLSVTGNMII